MKQIKLSLTLALLTSLTTLPAFATQIEKSYTINNFTGLMLEKGLDVQVLCADKPAVMASGSQKTIEQLKVTAVNNILTISGVTNDFDSPDFTNHKGIITIYTSQPINNIKTQFGVKLSIDGCAIDKKMLAIDSSMGSILSLKGETEKLHARLAMGAMLNTDPNDFQVKNAQVDLSMGAQAYLCNIEQLEGHAAMGAQVYVGSDTVNKLTAEMGSQIMRGQCR